MRVSELTLPNTAYTLGLLRAHEFNTLRDCAGGARAMSTGAVRRWVEIGFTVLRPEERTAHLPEDTQRVPYYCRLKGFAAGEPSVGDVVEVETQLGRRVRGEVLSINPLFSHGFGAPVEELIVAGLEARALLDDIDRSAVLSAPGGGEGL